MTEVIRVASVPTGHVYVRHLSWPGDGIERLPDPVVPGQDQWWPPAMLDPDWVAANHAIFDVFHVHFGFDGLTPRQLRAVCESLSEYDKPLVFTAHDLRNPHHVDRSVHDRQLEVLLEECDAVITLTARARDEIHKRFRRRATVIPHPHVLPLGRFPVAAEPPAQPLVGIHLKSLRANMIGDLALELALTEQECDIRVDIHSDAWREGPRELMEPIDSLARNGSIECEVHDYFSDREFLDYIKRLDIAVLPYAFGTHSGWLEACRDAGTGVVAPDCGCYSAQSPVHEFHVEQNGSADLDSFAKAVDSAIVEARRGRTFRTDPGMRRRQRKLIAARHRSVYRAVMSR